MTLDAFRDYLRKETEGYGSQRKAAHAWGISQAYLSDVLHGSRLPGPAILRAVGYQLTHEYRKIGGETDGP